MTDYDALYQRVYQEVIKREKLIDRHQRQFIDDLVKLLKAEGFELTDKSEKMLSVYADNLTAQISAGIITSGKVVYPAMANKEVLAFAESAFTRTWQDGKNLSDRLWVLNQDMKAGLTSTLQAGIKNGKSSSSLIYDMQRSFERDGRAKFLENYVSREDWVVDLFDSGKSVIKNPAMRQQWQRTVAEAREIISKLEVTGTRSAAEQAFNQMLKAVETGNEALLSSSLKWWGYDKQLYYLKRIARTEMATAAHNAVIDSTIDDDVIIGYQWRLSGSHPVTDICDMYANVDMGLGKGVFTKAKVPRAKAHPHCMCLLVPRVTQIKIAGKYSFEDLTKAMEK